MAQATISTAHSGRQKTGNGEPILASIMLGIMPATQIARAYIEPARNSRRRYHVPEGQRKLTIAAKAVADLANHLHEDASMEDLMSIILDHPEFRGVVVNSTSLFLTTGDYFPSKRWGDYKPCVEVWLQKEVLDEFKQKIVGTQVRKVIPRSDGKVYVDLAKVKELMCQHTPRHLSAWT